MARDHIEFVVVQDLPRPPVVEGENWPTGIHGPLLSYDFETGAKTFYATVQPHWIRRETGYYDADTEILVLKGDIHVGDTVLTAGHYSFIPAGCWRGAGWSDTGCEFLLMTGGKTQFTESDSDAPGARTDLRIDDLDAKGMPWGDPPSHPGRPAAEAPKGLGVKYLRQDPDTGAYTLMVRQAPGWFDPKLERHSIWEELFLVDGDYLMGRMGKVNAGTYIFRDGIIPHGPQVSKHGSVWFARGPAAIDFDYMDEPWAMELVDKYLGADEIFTGSHETGPWGDWM